MGSNLHFRKILWTALLMGPLLLGADRGDFPGLETGEIRLFRSNAMGMTIEEISLYRKEEYPHVLSVYREEEKEIRRLYEEGRLLTQWERIYQGERLIQEQEKTGETIIQRRYNRGLLTEEKLIKPQEPEELRKYLYGKKETLREISLFRDNVLVHKDVYLTDNRGRLLGVRRFEGEGPPRLNLYGQPSSELSREWHEFDGLSEFFQFRKGSLQMREVWKEGRLIEKEDWTDTEEGRMSRLNLPEEEREIIQYFDKEGVLISQEEKGAKETVKEQNVYVDGLLAEKVRRRSGERIKYSYKYDEDERLAMEEVEKNGLLVQRITFEDGGRERRETYRRGRLLVTVIYENDVPVETIYHGEETRRGKE